jgi:type IV fimbrial biogenesis protein FimT
MQTGNGTARRRRARGFTLVEALVALAIVGIMATLAAPSYQDLMVRNTVRSLTTEYTMTLHFARQTAVTLNRLVTVCPSTDGASCSTTEGLENGWIVVTGGQDAPESLLKDTLPSWGNGITTQFNATARHVTFAPSGRVQGMPIMTISVCPQNAANAALGRNIVISNTGRSRVAEPAAGTC